MRLPALDEIEVDGRREDEAAMQRLEREPAVAVAPRSPTPEIAPDRGVLLESEAAERVRAGWRCGALNGVLASSRAMSATFSGAKGAGGPSGLGRRACALQGGRRRGERGRESQFQEFPTRGHATSLFANRYARRHDCRRGVIIQLLGQVLAPQRSGPGKPEPVYMLLRRSAYPAATHNTLIFDRFTKPC